MATAVTQQPHKGRELDYCLCDRLCGLPKQRNYLLFGLIVLIDTTLLGVISGTLKHCKFHILNALLNVFLLPPFVPDMGQMYDFESQSRSQVTGPTKAVGSPATGPGTPCTPKVEQMVINPFDEGQF